MLIGGLQKTSLIDYPQKIACVIFTRGCNFRCSYCHNPELLAELNPEGSFYEESSVFDFLKKRQQKLDAVVISGGEPCLQKDLIPFMEKIKKMNFLIKLDTNGSYPDVLEEIITKKLVDYIAMDIKSPAEKYGLITNSKVDFELIKKSINLIKNSSIEHEFRTTVLKQFLSVDDLREIAKIISNDEKYFIQKFVPSKIYDETLKNSQNYNEQEFEEIKKDLINLKINCTLR